MSIIISFYERVLFTETAENKNKILPYYGNEDIAESLEWTPISYVRDTRPKESDAAFMLHGLAPKTPIHDMLLTIEDIVSIMRDTESVFFYREVNNVLEIGSNDVAALLRIKLTV